MITRMQRPKVTSEREATGTCTLIATGTRVDIISESTDLFTGKPFYVVRATTPGATWFGVWPDEVSEVTK